MFLRGGVLVQHPAKNAATKSKKSWELMAPVWLKSALGRSEKNAARKSKKSWEFRAPLPLKSAVQTVYLMVVKRELPGPVRLVAPKMALFSGSTAITKPSPAW